VTTSIGEQAASHAAFTIHTHVKKIQKEC